MPGSGGQWGLHFWSHRSETIGERVFGRLPFSRSYTDNGLKHTLVSLWRRLIYLSWSFGLRGWLQVYHTCRGYRRTLREYGLGHAIFARSIYLTITHQYPQEKRSLHLPGALIFFPTIIRRHLQIATRTGDQQGLWLWSHKLVYIAFFKKLLAEGLPSNQPETRCWMKAFPL